MTAIYNGLVNKKPVVTVTYTGPNHRSDTVVVNNVTYPIYNIWRVVGTDVNATNILNKVLVNTTTALTATDTTNSLKPGYTYTYFVIVQTPGKPNDVFSSMSNSKSVAVPK